MEDTGPGRYINMGGEDWLAWLNREIEYWSKVLDFISIDSTHPRATILDYLKELKSYINTRFYPGNLKEKLGSFYLPTHEFDPSQQLIEEAKNGRLINVLYSFKLAAIQSEFESRRQTDIAVNFLRETESLKASAAEKVNSRAEQIFSEFENHHKDALEKLTTATDTSISDAKKDIDTILNSTTDAIFSAEPVKYWDSRSTAHRANAATYKRWAIGSALLFIISLGLLIYFTYGDGTPVDLGIITVTVPKGLFLPLVILLTTAAIWIMKILLKLMMTNLALEIECIERSTMIKTYLAISSKDSSPLPEIRTLFYSSLFRPTPNSLSEDSTSPEYIKILETLLKFDKGKKAPE
ncbi:DUF6161 domain-containing protein [Pseudomonas sp. zfem004]|uniref:DUF6161 domain-containing protein n=1 Tax=Pseudomonas sp. zfem004 TaxID=3078199 RepID=UPI002929C825|nr:DUF6161 domain-containing protein [Pseudomonas sp. zfem004]MDU9405906.1 DUF6161 domain-containing protein [Pseudomonas sp. zfem004]